MNVMAQPWKHPKTGVYWCRRQVPKDIRSVFGKTEVKRSLRTKNVAEARRLFPSVYDSITSQFESCRRKLLVQHELDTRKQINPDKLTRKDVSILAARYFNQELKRLHESNTYDSYSEVAKYDLMLVKLGHWGDSAIDDELAQSVVQLNDPNSYELQDLDSLQEVLGGTADALLVDAGLAVPANSPSYQYLLVELVKVVKRLQQTAAEILVGDYETSQELPQADQSLSAKPLADNAGAPKLTLDALFKEYEESLRLYNKGRDKTLNKTIKDYSVVVSRFCEVFPRKSVKQVTRQDIDHFKTLLLKLPTRPKRNIAELSIHKQIEKAEALNLPLLSPATVKKQLMALSAVFEFAKEKYLIDVNPVHGSTKRLAKAITNRKGSDKQYDNKDLQTIFSSPIYREGFRGQLSKYGEAVYWLPLLAYYTGCRVEELAQLYVEDVRLTDGIYHLSIEANDTDKSVKNAGSNRQVPLHDDLITLGFIDYVNSLSGSQRLFPSLKLGSDGRYATRVGKWITHYFRTTLNVGLDVRVFHAFRHTFKTKARLSGIPKDVADVINGHSSGDVSGTYGEYPLQLLKSEIDKLPSVPVELNQIAWSP